MLSNKHVITNSKNTLTSNKILLANSSLNIDGFGKFNMLFIDHNSNLYLNHSNITGDIYNYGKLIVNEKCNHNKNIYNYESDIMLKSGGFLLIDGTMINESNNITFYSTNMNHWYDASYINANNITGDTTLVILKKRIIKNNEQFCWSLLIGNTETNYIFNNYEYEYSNIVKKNIYIWVCLNSYYITKKF